MKNGTLFQHMLVPLAASQKRAKNVISW